MNHLRRLVSKLISGLGANVSVVVDGTGLDTFDGLMSRLGSYNLGTLTPIVLVPAGSSVPNGDANGVRLIETASNTLADSMREVLSAARTEYVAWLGPECSLAPDALTALVTSLASTRSAAAIGHVSLGPTLSEASRRSHAESRKNITLGDVPQVAWNNSLGGILFKAKILSHFLERLDRAGHNGVQETEFVARFVAEGYSVDLLDEVTCTIGDPGRGRASLVADVNEILARWHSMKTVSDSLPAGGGDEWLVRALDHDLRPIYQSLPAMSDDSGREFAAWMMSLIRAAEARDLRVESRENRVLAHVISGQSLSEARRFICSLEEPGGRGHIEPDASGGFLWTYPYGTYRIPRELLSVEPTATWFNTSLIDYAPQADGSLVLTGQIPASNLSCEHITDIHGFLARRPDPHEEADLACPVSVERIESPLASFEASTAFVDQSRAGYRLTMPPPSALHNQIEAASSPLFPVLRATLTGGAQVYLPVTRRDYRGSASRLSPGVVVDGMAWQQEIMDGALAVRETKPRAYLTDVSLSDSHLRARLILTDVRSAVAPAALRFRGNAGSDIDVPIDEGIVNFDLTALTDSLGSHLWTLQVFDGHTWIPCTGHPGRDDSGKATDFAIDVGWGGEFRLKSVRSTLSIANVSFEDGPSLVLEATAGTELAQDVNSLQILLRGQGLEFPGHVTDHYGHHLTITVNLVSEGSDGLLHPPSGTYILECRSQSVTVSVIVDPSAVELPRYIFTDRGRYLLSRRHQSGDLAIAVSSPLSYDESGAYNENRLIGDYQQFVAQSSTPLAHAVLFYSFGGKNISDSTRGIDEEMVRRGTGMTRYWAVSDPAVRVPDGARPVVIGSTAWFEVLATASLIIANTTLPSYFRKRDGQIYVQTWHGTPLKKIGHDVPAVGHSSLYREQLTRESRHYWDYLLAQSPEAGETIRKAFDYEGVVLDQGYPRNDALVMDRVADLSRSELRQRFGIDASETVVFYAPTWRDNLRTRDGRYSSEWLLDIEALASELGDNYVILTRAHSQTVDRPASLATLSTGRVINIPQYVDVNVPLAISDVLVTDYSSIMFDYAATGRPILLFIPDRENYEHRVRELYVDLTHIAPSDLFSNEVDLARAIRNIGDLSNDERQHALLTRFARFDDGRASERVIDALILDGHDLS